jgi:anaerobic selenocysteine-containing dehydrogenase
LQFSSESEKNVELKYGYCRNNCMLHCGRIAVVKNGRVVEIRGWKGHPISDGKLCAKGLAAIDDTYGPNRVLYPMKRIGDKFERISWEKALDEIAEKLREIRKEWDGKPLHHMTAEEMRRVARYATPRNSCGEAEYLYYMRFGRTFISSLNYSGCVACNGNWWRARLATTGFNCPVNTIDTIVDSKLIIDFGYNIAETAVVSFKWVKEAIRRGAEFIYIDPRFTKTAAHATEYIPIRPGTDGALVLGLMNVLVRNGWTYPYLKYYVDEEEFNRFVEEIVKKYPPEKVEEITWVPSKKIEELAKKIHEAGRKVAILAGTRTSTQISGFNTNRLIVMLHLMIGSYGVSGGGDYNPKPGVVPADYVPLTPTCSYKYPAIFYPDDAYDWTRGWVPETRWPEVKEQIKAYFGLGGNPIIRSAGDQRGLYEYLKEHGLIVIGTTEWNEMCDYAHYVLPLATDLESSGSTFLCSTLRAVQWKDAAVPPMGEAKQDLWILNEICRRVYGDESMYRECPDCEKRAKEILADGGTLDDVWNEIVKPWADKIKAIWNEERRKPGGKYLDDIINEVAEESVKATGHCEDHKYVIRNRELIFREDLKEWGEKVGFDLDNHGLLWPYNIFKQGPEAVYHYWWRLEMLMWPLKPGTPAAMDPERCHPFSGLRLDIVKEKKVVYWPAPLCLMEKDPDYRGEKVFFERCPNCWKTAKELGMPEIPLLWTPPKRWNQKTNSFYPWKEGKAFIDLKGETWYGAGLPDWTEPAEKPRDISQKIDWNEEYPLIMITGKLAHLMTGYSQNVNVLLTKIEEKPFVWIHPSTAEHLGIKDGDIVKIITPRSPKNGLKIRVKLTTLIHPKVVFVPTHTGPKAINEDFRNEGVMLVASTAEDPYTRMIGYSTNVCRVERVDR